MFVTVPHLKKEENFVSIYAGKWLCNEDPSTKKHLGISCFAFYMVWVLQDLSNLVLGKYQGKMVIPYQYTFGYFFSFQKLRFKLRNILWPLHVLNDNVFSKKKIFLDSPYVQMWNL